MTNSHTSTKRKSSLALGIVVSCVSVFLIIGASYWWLMNQYGPNPQARVEMRHFMQRIELGDSRETVQLKFKTGNYRVLKLHDSFVGTPFELGADWQLHLEYDKEKLAAMRLRISDGIKHRPREKDTPPDQVAPNWKSPLSNEAWGLK